MFKLQNLIQSFIIVFAFTVTSNILCDQIVKAYGNLTKPTPEKITSKTAEDVQELIYKEILNDAKEPVAVFFYQNDYSSRIKFESNTTVAKPVINDVRTDSEYSRILEYHKQGLCYEQDVSDINKNSSLYAAYEALNFNNDFPTYYVACPIIINNKLTGYIGTFFSLDTPSRPSLRVSKLNLLTKVVAEVLDPYF